ncbi:MAG: DUF4886 domain-containing protein [Bacilli bacterium]
MIRVLSISNSFGVDGTTFLHQISTSFDTQIEVGTLFIGGCEISRHVNNLQNNIADYEYYLNGSLKKVNATILEVLKPIDDEESPWDYIVFQQASGFSGIESSFHPYLENLISLVKKYNKHAIMALHETWSYAKDFDNTAYIPYQHSQSQMGQMIDLAYTHVAHDLDIPLIIPSLKVIEKARSIYGDQMNRDGYHLTEEARYLVACCWALFLLKKDATKFLFVPTYSSLEGYKPLKKKKCQELYEIARGVYHQING